MPNIFNFDSEFNKVLKKPFIIKDISRSDLGGNIHYLITLDNDIHIHSSFLKPEYKVVPEFGRVAMIDLQNFDIYHAVEKIINNKERCSLIAFPFNKKNKQN